MNRERFNWGLILLFIGGVLLLRNFGYIDFYWRSFFKMWPVIIILFGVHLLLPKKGIGAVLSVLLTILALAFLSYQGTRHPRENFRWDDFNSKGRTLSQKTETSISTDNFSKSKASYDILLDPTMQVGHLKLIGGGSEYSIEGFEGDYLLQAKFDHSSRVTYNNSHKQVDSLTTVDFKMNSTKGLNMNDGSNDVAIRINKHIRWKIDLTSGAGIADFDLKEVRVESLKFKGGASSFNVLLGDPLEDSNVEVESGVATVDIEIPRSAACRIVVRTGMTSRNFEGFEKQGDGSYITPGYHQATNKYNIVLKGGLSSFSVKKYD
jgi:hypothetical protein